MLTADATPAQMQRLLASGATAYLTKPVDIRDVFAVLDSVLKPRPQGSPERVTRHAGTIVVADDLEANLDLFTRLLTRDGYTVLPARRRRGGPRPGDGGIRPTWC